MCKVINFNEYRGNKAAKERKQIAQRTLTDRKLRVQELMSVDWMKEYIQKGWSISDMLFHIIEQYDISAARMERSMFLRKQEEMQDTMKCIQR